MTGKTYKPGDSPGLVPYINVAGAASAISWYQNTLGAQVRNHLTLPDGQVMHAELVIDNNLVMITDANPEWGTRPPDTQATYSLCLYVQDCDALFERCIAEGAQALQEPEDQFWGDRSGRLKDPYGVVWVLMTHQEAVSEEELQTRFRAMMEDSQA